MSDHKIKRSKRAKYAQYLIKKMSESYKFTTAGSP
jgi:hypothetical protein